MDYENQMEITTEKRDKVESKDKLNNMTKNNDPVTKVKQASTQPTIRYHQLDRGPYTVAVTANDKSSKPTSHRKIPQNQ
jgi:hypothetical protein